ncbi:flavodoxin domain-containing protein [Planococcus lenghuensis]|uniref:Flavodoxin-like domain-containing protein n=1 Tax=Planococcus lenghuensis TaxID=2213202 RepID=A0A1Q2KUM3_9BACL|nr:flavodoxin domain-containing protein [Planococcus lenghuensis]AQQ51910.1 hypothetical protein B0X71_01435 [Planococcus lenghuensis]
MAKICLIFTSMTGNTEEIADLLEVQLQKHDIEILKKNISREQVKPEELDSCTAILFGTYTYGDGELPFETEDFADDLTAAALHGKAVGLFGSGDRSYDQFCGALDEMAARFQNLGAHVVEPVVKIELDPQPKDEDPCSLLVNALFDAINSVTASSR